MQVSVVPHFASSEAEAGGGYGMRGWNWCLFGRSGYCIESVAYCILQDDLKMCTWVALIRAEAHLGTCRGLVPAIGLLHDRD